MIIADAVLMRGASETARYVEEVALESQQFLNKSFAFGYESVLRGDLPAVWEECNMPNWDGYDALPVEESTFRNACRFLEFLPFGLPKPSVGAEPDGHITFEWYQSVRRLLSVSISPDAKLHYAALLGLKRAYGTEVYYQEVPEVILNLIRQVDAT